MNRLRLSLSEAALTDILEPTEWYEHQAEASLSKRWERAYPRRCDGLSCIRVRAHNVDSSPVNCAGSAERQLQDFSKHLIFYRTDKEDLLVLRVVHGAQDLESLF